MGTSLQMVGGKPIQRKGAGTGRELAEVELGWRGGPGRGDLWAPGGCPDRGQGNGHGSIIALCILQEPSRWALGLSPLSRKDTEL
jgi:hypothetical protein